MDESAGTSFDRHITETTNNQSSDHTINGLHDQETSQSNNKATMFQQTKHEVCQSSLQQLPQPLFEAICDWLQVFVFECSQPIGSIHVST